MNFLERSAIRRAERVLAGVMEGGEQILEFDIGKYSDGASVHVVATDRAVYLAAARKPGPPIRIPYVDVAVLGGGLTHLELLTLDDLRIWYRFTKGSRPIYQFIEARLAALPRTVFRQQIGGTEVSLTYRPCIGGNTPASWTFDGLYPEVHDSHASELERFKASAKAILSGGPAPPEINADTDSRPHLPSVQRESVLLGRSWMQTFADHFCASAQTRSARSVAEVCLIDDTGTGPNRVLITTDQELLVVDHHHLFERDWVRFPWDRTMFVELCEPEAAGQLVRLAVFDDRGALAAGYAEAINANHGWLLLLGFDQPVRDAEALEDLIELVRSNEKFHYPN